MDFRDVVRRRRMTRRYDATRPVDRADVDALVDTGLRAPSAGDSQGWHFLVLDDAESVKRYWSATADDGPDDRWLAGMRSAPVLIVVFSHRATYETRYRAADKADGRAPVDLAERWPVPYWDIDAGMAAMLIQLAAIDRGLACCLFAVPSARVDALRVEFGVPAGFAAVGVVSVGHAADAAAAGRRRAPRTRSTVVSYATFGHNGRDIETAPPS